MLAALTQQTQAPLSSSFYETVQLSFSQTHTHHSCYEDICITMCISDLCCRKLILIINDVIILSLYDDGGDYYFYQYYLSFLKIIIVVTAAAAAIIIISAADAVVINVINVALLAWRDCCC